LEFTEIILHYHFFKKNKLNYELFCEFTSGSYYYNFKDKVSNLSKRKKIYSCEEHNIENLKYAISITNDILKSEIINQILEEERVLEEKDKEGKKNIASLSNLDENFNVEDFTLNEA